MDMVSGMVRMSLYPRWAATMARPTPVFPLVGSMMVPPGASRPFFSASSTIALAMRSLMDPPGFMASYLPRTVASLLARSERSTRGVEPMRASICFAVRTVVPPSCIS